MRTGVGVQTRLLLPDRPYNAASRHRRVIGRCHRQHVYSQSSNSSPVGPVDHNAGRLSQVASPRAPLPYASLSVPVYSLVTRGSHDGSRNATMNLVTYAIPVSIEPRQFQICLLRSTLSFENFVHNGEGVLQVLSQEHARLFHLLGKQSGRDVDKFREMGVQNVVLRNYHNYSVLQSAVGLMKLKIESHISGAGDHDIFICGIEDWETAASATGSLALYTGTLRDQGLL